MLKMLMEEKIKQKINYIKSKSERLKSLGVFAALSLLISLVFAGYNCYLGIAYKIIWNISISIYYLALSVTRGVSLLVYVNVRKKNKEYPFSAFVIVSLLTSLITIAMTYPAILMVENQREVNMTIIPAIALAAFTTYKVYSSIKDYIAYKKDRALYSQQCLVVNVIATIVSVLTIQNTLIMVNGGMTEDMRILSTSSTIVFLTFSLAISIISLIFGIKKNIQISKDQTNVC